MRGARTKKLNFLAFLVHIMHCIELLFTNYSLSFFALFALFPPSLSGEKPVTLNADWVAAEKDYTKFQNLNPIFGQSRKQ
jgi:hypothetical protein